PGIARNLSKEFDSDWANNAVDPLVKDTIFDNNAALSKIIFNDKHPYFKATEKKAKPTVVISNIPKELERYEKELGVVVNKEVFKYLKRDTPLYTVEPDGQPKIRGAYYRPDANFVKIPIDERRKNSKWYAQAVVHHEFGHAIDFQTGLRDSDKIKSLMNEARKMYTSAEMKEIYIKAQKTLFSGDNDAREKHAAVLDTIASIRPAINMNQTHPDAYWKKAGYKEAEFIAHISENKFSGNDVFKELMPALYKKMVDFEFD
ncbi:zinc-dependent peptidase, partial [Flavobacterium fluviatile]|uniref:zinc-dependent peptidase n=1 Tax=Flavobacterium fluviatile TaxID=1862387 RepID=UPI0013D52B41